MSPTPFDPEPSVSLAGVRLLVIDESPNAMFVIGSALREVGADVSFATDRHDAVSQAKAAEMHNAAFGLIVLGMDLPSDEDGYAVAQSLRSQNIEVPILGLTSKNLANDRTACLDAGCSAVISKPVDHRQLLCAAANLIALSGGGPDDELLEEEPVVSRFAEYPTMLATLEQFVEELPQQVDDLARAMRRQDIAQLAWHLHTLSDDAERTGFESISESAREAEKTLCDETLSTEDDLDRLEASISSLFDLCQRAISGIPQPNDPSPLPPTA